MIGQFAGLLERFLYIKVGNSNGLIIRKNPLNIR